MPAPKGFTTISLRASCMICPEVLTRDIVSPVKSSVEGLEETIKRYEKIHLEETILPLLPSPMREEIVYFLEDEFSNKVLDEGKVIKRRVSRRYDVPVQSGSFLARGRPDH